MTIKDLDKKIESSADRLCKKIENSERRVLAEVIRINGNVKDNRKDIDKIKIRMAYLVGAIGVISFILQLGVELLR